MTVTASRATLWTVAAGLATGAAVAARRMTARPQRSASENRWLTVTVNRAPGDVDPAQLPSPLREYGDRIETRVGPAPGDRGMEVAVRLREPGPASAHSVPARLTGTDPRQDLRRALREVKALLEAGEVLRPDAPPATRETPGAKLIAVWGCGAVGQMAARAAILLGAELRERIGGRGPDVCIEAVGMEAHSDSPVHLYDQVKQQLRLQTDRPTAVRQAIHACRTAGTVFILEVFAGAVDKFPLGAVINKGLTVRGAQQRGQRHIPMLLGRLAKGELSASHLATRTVALDRAPDAYDRFKHKTDGCVRAVIRPDG